VPVRAPVFTELQPSQASSIVAADVEEMIAHNVISTSENAEVQRTERRRSRTDPATGYAA
jgi:hypothetical protein